MTALARYLERHPLRLIRAVRGTTPLVCPTHRHPWLELVIHHECAGWTALPDGRRFDFSPGMAALYPPGLAHDQLSDPPGDDLCLHLRPSAPLPAELTRFQLFPADPLALATALDLIASPAGPGPLGRLADSLRATGLVARLFALGASDAHGRPPADRHLAAARAHIRRHYATIGSLTEVAHAVGLSPVHLRHLFKTTDGTTLVGYLTEVRLERAKQLLRTTRLPLAAIANACGFATDRYFCRVFNRCEGRTPSAFRREG